MEEEDRIGGLKRAVNSFLEKLPEGSKVAVIAFGSEVDRLSAFTTDRGEVKPAVDALEPAGATRFYDAVAIALEMLEHETGRRAVLALTDGEDTFSQSASLESVIGSGPPARTAGLHAGAGNRRRDRERRPPPPRRVDAGPVLPGPQRRPAPRDLRTDRRADPVELPLVYQSDRKLPDGTLRPVRIFYRGSQTAAGETAVFIPGMVVPSGGWSPLFLALMAVLTTLVVLPGALARRRARA